MAVDYLALKKLPESYQCQLCGELMKDPLQTFRGNVACSLCYKNAQSDDGICPIDHEPITRDEIFRDRAKAKEILKLQCFCENKERGCGWTATLKELKTHICNYALGQCEFCDQSYAQDKEVAHFKNCEGIYKRGDCILQSVGCTFKADTKEDMEKHMQEDAGLHLLYQTKFHENIHSMNNELQKNFQQQHAEQKKKDEALNTEIALLKKTIEESSKEVKEFQKRTKEQITQLNQALQNVLTKTNHTSTTVATAKTNEKSPAKQIANIGKKNSNNISELDLRFQLHENTTHDGRILWKIDNFTRRRQEAITGKITALHSAPCFTSQYGYKFCARLYMNGDGMGRGTHMSLFTVLMKSEYDNLLEWPFLKQVNFTLINQVDRQRNIVERLIPGKDSASFKKPVKEMNIASGCPLFAPLDKLESEGFVKDDCLFIEIKINS